MCLKKKMKEVRVIQSSPYLRRNWAGDEQAVVEALSQTILSKTSLHSKLSQEADTRVIEYERTRKKYFLKRKV